MNWDNMKVFLAIVRTGSINKAAIELDIHHTTCARRIKTFEDELAVKLFDRLPNGYALSQAGESLYHSGQVIRQEFTNIETELAGKDLSLEGDICLTIPLGFALNLLMPDLRDFIQQYPEVNLKINMTYEKKDLANREADIAIRHVDNPPDSLAGKRVARVYKAAYASTAYLQSHDPQTNPAQCTWLGWGSAENHLQWAGKARYPEIPVSCDMYSDVLQLEGVKQNMGIASLPCFLADQTCGIERIDNSEPTPGDWIWVLAHKDMARNAKVRILIEFLNKAFQKYRHVLQGQC